MTKICDLPKDLTEEVLSRVPLTSLRRVRSTCRKWNTLFKNMSFAKKHLAQANLAAAEAKVIMVVMMMDFRVSLMRSSLSTNNDNNNVDESCVIKHEAKIIGPDCSDEVDVCQVFHCEGLLLCITRDYTKLVAWNPYWGKARWIEPTHSRLNSLDWYTYALGYDKSSNSHKILRFVDPIYTASVVFEIYEFNSDSWRVLVFDVALQKDWRIKCFNGGVSLNGNTYWFARKTREPDFHSFLICFDFTRETFGPPLPLPFQTLHHDFVSLSIVREEQLAVLFQPLCASNMEIWVTTKIEPDAMSWSSKVFLSPKAIHPRWQMMIAPSFFIDEEKKVAVVFDKYRIGFRGTTCNVACIFRVDGSLKEAAIGKSARINCEILGCSYVPSLVQLN